MNEPFLTAQNLHKIYRNGSKEVRAVNGVSLELEKGESLAIIGASGAGKSTLLHLLGGLDKPTSGKVKLERADLYAISEKGRAGIRNRRIGFIFQFYHLLPEFSALENVMLPALIQKEGSKAMIRDRARHVLKSVGLDRRLDHRPGELSGGESQRVAIARALVNEPHILLCDEPTGNLDSKTSESIYELLLSIQATSNMSMIIVTHDEGISRRINRKVHIKDGKIFCSD